MASTPDIVRSSVSQLCLLVLGLLVGTIALSISYADSWDPLLSSNEATPTIPKTVDGSSETSPPIDYPAKDTSATFGEITIETKDVYDLNERRSFFYRVVNTINPTVREEVVRREVEAVFKPGDPYDPSLLKEVERNLRKLPFIAKASASATPRENDVIDVHVVTHDQVSVSAGAGVSFFGGSSKFRASVSESDLFGYGKGLKAIYKSDEDKNTQEIKYSDPQLFGSDHRLRLDFADSTDGHDYGLRLDQPFKTLATRWSYGINAGDKEFRTRFFEDGDEVARVPVERAETGLFLRRSYGDRQKLLRPGLKFAFRDDEYDMAEGDEPDTIDVPDDQRTYTFGPTMAANWLPRFEERQQVDAIDYVEDISIGVQLDGFAGFQRRHGDNGNRSHEAVGSLSALGIESFGEDHLLSAKAAGELRYHSGDFPGWTAGSFLHYYFQGLPAQTLVLAAAIDALWESEDLFTQLTLGEDNGLRGYPIRQFSGHKRLRFNVEDRIFTNLEILSVKIGAVAFFDAGMVWDRGETLDLSDVAKSVGIGLRLGSSELLGKKVVRLDFGYPLDSFDGEDFGLSVSATLDQVIELDRNAEELESENAFDL